MKTLDFPWSVPLVVRLQNGCEHLFSSVYDALDFLENEWPLRRGQKYDRAVNVCRAAINKMAPVAVAREAFIAACLEAGLHTTASPSVLGKTSKGGGVHSPSQ